MLMSDGVDQGGIVCVPQEFKLAWHSCEWAHAADLDLPANCAKIILIATFHRARLMNITKPSLILDMARIAKCPKLQVLQVCADRVTLVEGLRLPQSFLESPPAFVFQKNAHVDGPFWLLQAVLRERGGS